MTWMATKLLFTKIKIAMFCIPCLCSKIFRHFLTGWALVGLSLGCALTGMSFRCPWVDVVYRKPVVAGSVVESILGGGVLVDHAVRTRKRILHLFVCRKSRNKRFPLTRMLRRLWHTVLDGDTAKRLIVPYVNMCCFDYIFPAAWFSTRCEHFPASRDFEDCFRERTLPSPIFVTWHCVKAFLLSI